jgi:hypothetical protein
MVADSALYTAPNLEMLTNLLYTAPNERNVNQFKMVDSCAAEPKTSAATGISTCRNQNFMKAQ